MDDKEKRLREDIAGLSERLAGSKLRTNDLKKKLAVEETKAIGLRLAKEDLEECLRKHLVSLPSDTEKDRREAVSTIDADFVSRLPGLLEKV